MDPRLASKIMRQAAYDLLSEADACTTYEKTSDEWRFLCVKLYLLLAETKDYCADILEQIAVFNLKEGSANSLPSGIDNLANPPFEADYFNSSQNEL